jgi:predicted aldo/keto reductase-like oxidoreductase
MRISKPEAAHLVREIIDLGINFIDTAHGYSDSEEKIGEAIKGIKRDEIIIASKSPADSKKTFLEHLDLSLKRLGTEYIDIYQFHGVSSKTKSDIIFSSGGAMEGMEEAIKVGKIRFPAFSSHSIPIAIELMKTGIFSSVQLPFNYIDCAAADEAIPLAKELDIGFIAMKPMGGGLLNDAGLSFRYLGQYDSIVPDPGIEKIEEILEIVNIVGKNECITQNDLENIKKQRVEFGPSWCHRCDYCLPCSQGIQISLALNVKSIFKRMHPERAMSFVGPVIEKAKNCLECRTCLTRCPYNLDIPSLLKGQINMYEALV